MISLVVTDLDGTLWAEDEVVPYAHQAALNHLANSDIPIMTIGDGANDVAMHHESFRAIGVRGGHPDAVAAAEHLIDPSSLGGWAQILELL